MVKAIIFDCYGVLYPDTFWTLASKYLGDQLDSKQGELHDLIKSVDLGYKSRDELWHEFAKLCGRSTDEVYEDLKEFGGLDKRLLTMIEWLKSQYKIGMISNVGQGFIERMFTDKPASFYFDSLVLSSDVGLVKPDRRIYELAASQLGVETSECLFIDDLQKNVDGALSAGMHALRYDTYEKFQMEIQQYTSDT